MTVITIIEDDDALRLYTARFLERAGYEVYALREAEEVFIHQHNTDIFIVDLNLPDMSGYELIEGIRQINESVGIIILSARSRVSDVVKGYDDGADVYLSKPCDPDVLLASIQRLRRRSGSLNSEFLGCIVNLSTSEAIGPERRCSLSRKELSLLQSLAIAGDRGLERHEVAEILDIDLDKNAKTINVYISRLRQRLSGVWELPHIIETLHGFGYRLCSKLHFV